jgi:hypothetical protein
MKLSITKGELVFITEITAINCDNAKQLALANDFVFELVIPEMADSNIVKAKIIKSKELFSFLKIDNKSKEKIIDFYKAFSIDFDTNDYFLQVIYLSISCKGKVKIIIHAPLIDSGFMYQPLTSLKVGVGFTFDSDLRFLANEMICI